MAYPGITKEQQAKFADLYEQADLSSTEGGGGVEFENAWDALNLARDLILGDEVR